MEIMQNRYKRMHGQALHISQEQEINSVPEVYMFHPHHRCLLIFLSRLSTPVVKINMAARTITQKSKAHVKRN